MAIFAAAGSLGAQLITNTAAVPRTGKPPVVLLSGYQFGCEGNTSFESSFGAAHTILERDGRPSLFFDNCEQARNEPIEQIGAALGRYLDSLRYTDGQPVAQVDVVAHSMGGNIVRSYLSGKQPERYTFRPPAEVKIRKAVFLAVPFFGAAAATLAGAPNDEQTRQLTPGSTFLWDLATWNQGTDDLRGVDAVAITGLGGTGLASGLDNFDDSTVATTSGSIDFLMSDRTRVLQHCHATLSGLFALGCRSGTPAIARWTDERHEAARIALSFLNGTADWQSIGQSGAEATQRGGLFVQVRDAEDRVVNLRGGEGLNVRGNEIAWSDRLAAGTASFRITPANGADLSLTAPVPDGSTRAIIVGTAGPNVGAIFPSAAAVYPRTVAPGMFVSVYGTALAASTEQAQSQPYPSSLGGTQVLVNGNPVGVHYASPQQVNAVVPENANGLVQVTVRTSQGTRTVNVLVEAAVPALFGAATNAVTGAVITATAPIGRGEYVALYLTGLGATEQRADGLEWARIQPEVTVGGRPCRMTYAGRAPGYVGLDQVNCQVAADAPTGNVEAIVTSGRRSGRTTIPVQ
ncbi:MAG TPA: IPT/TIG domain-containing protein [Bryobacteraceae bacterium]|nr:IPT/TIG domain-containing protein [Bryobacteraceae bacterium]